ncbi:MAG: aminotransferase class IV, partial [bacterium]
REAILETVRRCGLRDAYVRPVISRGTGDLGLDPRKCKTATVVIIVDTIQLYPKEAYERGLRVITATTRKHRPDALSPQAKTLNYLNNILARMEANQAGVDEAIMLTTEGFVSECSADNFYVMHDGAVWTAPPALGILVGVTRGVVFDLAAALGIPVHEKAFTLHDVYAADEAFLSGTGAEIGPVVEVDARPIGSGRPGPLVQRLLRAFRDLVAREGTPVFGESPVSTPTAASAAGDR